MDPETHPKSGEKTLTREPEIPDLAHVCRLLNEAGARYVLVGGFAIIAHGYPRFTADIDLLVEPGHENEEKVLSALAKLPDGVARELRPGDVEKYGVVRIGDEVLVDLMKRACGVDYQMAAETAEEMEIGGVKIPVASPAMLWRMKQTHREKDIPDRIFLMEWAREKNVILDPPPDSQSRKTQSGGWLVRLAEWVERKFSPKK
jgi:hypothetical protein